MLWVLLAAAAVVAIVLIWLAASYNSFNYESRRVAQTWSNLDVALQNRWETIPALVTVVKGAAGFEQGTLTQVVQARAEAISADTLGERAAAEERLGNSLGRLFALGEAYPDLTASSNYAQLQGQIVRIQEDIVYARRLYNSNVTEYNTHLTSFPARLAASLFKSFTLATLFEIDDTSMRAMPSLDL